MPCRHTRPVAGTHAAPPHRIISKFDASSLSRSSYTANSKQTCCWALSPNSHPPHTASLPLQLINADSKPGAPHGVGAHKGSHFPHKLLRPPASSGSTRGKRAKGRKSCINATQTQGCQRPRTVTCEGMSGTKQAKPHQHQHPSFWCPKGLQCQQTSPASTCYHWRQRCENMKGKNGYAICVAPRKPYRNTQVRIRTITMHSASTTTGSCRYARRCPNHVCLPTMYANRALEDEAVMRCLSQPARVYGLSVTIKQLPGKSEQQPRKPTCQHAVVKPSKAFTCRRRAPPGCLPGGPVYGTGAAAGLEPQALPS